MNHDFEERERRIITTTKTGKTLFIGLDLGQAKDFSALAASSVFAMLLPPILKGCASRKRTPAASNRSRAETGNPISKLTGNQNSKCLATCFYTNYKAFTISQLSFNFGEV
jgi:hypothetical protein